jgi:hypothetical protein
MRKITLLLIIINLNLFAQENELKEFKKELVFFISYDNNKIDTLQKTELNTEKYKIKLETSFKKFCTNPDSKNLDNLKLKGIKSGSTYSFGNETYSFHEQKRDYLNKEIENNINYCISFYGIYDYKLSNFISIYIQPFKLDSKDYIIYYYKLNGKGKYYVKDENSNKIIFESDALTSNAPILKIEKVESNNYLLIENMQNLGQRAFIVKNENTKWTSISAFKGQSIDMKTFVTKKETNSRKYLWIANNKNMTSRFGEGYDEKPLILFDSKTKKISYNTYSKTSKEVKEFSAVWKNSTFTIDDYFIGKDYGNDQMPYPE